MSVSVNVVVVAGNLTRDPELKHLPSGTAVAEVGLAVNSREKRGETWQDRVDFIDCSFFGRTAEVLAEYTKKGDAILVEGKLRLDQWESQGQKRSKLKVIADRMQMLGGKKEGGGSRSSFTQKAQDNFGGTSMEPPADDSSIPF